MQQASLFQQYCIPLQIPIYKLPFHIHFLITRIHVHPCRISEADNWAGNMHSCWSWMIYHWCILKLELKEPGANKDNFPSIENQTVFLLS
jgi:hypothetical protein